LLPEAPTDFKADGFRASFGDGGIKICPRASEGPSPLRLFGGQKSARALDGL
jgi:hypothetical protein